MRIKINKSVIISCKRAQIRCGRSGFGDIIDIWSADGQFYNIHFNDNCKAETALEKLLTKGYYDATDDEVGSNYY